MARLSHSGYFCTSFLLNPLLPFLFPVAQLTFSLHLKLKHTYADFTFSLLAMAFQLSFATQKLTLKAYISALVYYLNFRCAALAMIANLFQQFHYRFIFCMVDCKEVYVVFSLKKEFQMVEETCKCLNSIFFHRYLRLLVLLFILTSINLIKPILSHSSKLGFLLTVFQSQVTTQLFFVVGLIK